MRLLRFAGFVASAVLAAGSCNNAGEELATGVTGTNTINAGAFFDRDGSGAFNTPDTILAGIRIDLVSPGGTQVISSGLTDVNGVVNFTAVDVGRYTIVVDTAGLGDSLGFTGAAPAEVTITALGPPQNIAASYGFETSSIQAVRALAVGTRVLVRGGVLAGRVTFVDSTAYIADPSGAIRLTAASGAVSLPGDSVRVIGTIATRGGQPVIDQAQMFGFFLVAPGDPVPVPDSVSTNVAAHASGGALDAALALVAGATIIDTSTVGNDFVVQVNDGTGVLDVVFDLAVNPPATPAAPGATVRAVGVLVPATGSTWQLKPRETADVTIN
jgi:hypothetical protein